VVGWVDFEAHDVRERIRILEADGGGKLKGLRPMVQDLPDPEWLRDPRLDAAFEAMVAEDLVFDALVRPLHLPALRWRLVRHPGLRAVVDHAGKPDISRGAFDEWAEDLARLARDTTACCKLSGLLTEAGTRGSPAELAPYVQHVLRWFGPDRVLWGSDWPVLNLAGDYARWLELARDLVDRFAPGARGRVFGATAQRLYGLELEELVQS
jgi:L-fuconolactonase